MPPCMRTAACTTLLMLSAMKRTIKGMSTLYPRLSHTRRNLAEGRLEKGQTEMLLLTETADNSENLGTARTIGRKVSFSCRTMYELFSELLCS